MFFKFQEIMKKILILFIAFFSLMSVHSQENKPEISFEKTVIDYGTVNKGDNGVREFVFKNTGNAPLIISNVKSTCGCTIPKKPEKPILPGESENIQVKYDTKRVGFIRKSITVTSNAASSPTTILKIKGQVVENNHQKGIERKKKSIVEVY